MTNRSDNDTPRRGYRSRREMLTMSIGAVLFCVATIHLLGNNTPVAYAVLAAGLAPVLVWTRWGRKAFPLKLTEASGE